MCGSGEWSLGGHGNVDLLYLYDSLSANFIKSEATF